MKRLDIPVFVVCHVDYGDDGKRQSDVCPKDVCLSNSFAGTPVVFVPGADPDDPNDRKEDPGTVEGSAGCGTRNLAWRRGRLIVDDADPINTSPLAVDLVSEVGPFVRRTTTITELRVPLAQLLAQLQLPAGADLVTLRRDGDHVLVVTQQQAVERPPAPPAGQRVIELPADGEVPF